MKKYNHQLKIISLAALLTASLLLIGCGNLNTDSSESDLKQSEEDLLIGVSRAICYSGFREGQHPDRGEGAVNPSYEETLEDLKILSRDSYFKLIRLYDSGENSQMILKVIDENSLDIKVMLGIWLKAEISNHENCWWLTEPIPEEVLRENKEMNIKEIKTAIGLAGKYHDIIVSVAVGNEALVEWNDHMVEVDTVISYVKWVKSEVKQPVTVADNFYWWANDGLALSKVVDFVSVHTYPIWEGQDIDTALAYSIGNIRAVHDSLNGPRIVITEAGWATLASEFGERASEEKQEIYYNQIMSWAEEMNYTVFFFEAFDEPWKGDPGNPLGAEKHWGIFNVDRTPKKVMQKMYPDLMK
jgi:exo-beta-1,3-glucanase (GH17 family)